MEVLRAVLTTVSWPVAAAAFLAENVLLFALALGAGALGLRWFSARRVAAPPEPLGLTEVALAVITVLINTAVTLLGLLLFRTGWIRFRTDTGARALLDILVLTAVMDALMYMLHRVAHHPLFYARVHALHHRYVRVRPLTLFVLHPLETVAFGGLWLAFLCLYQASWLGMSVYLALNVAFGIIGHLGVEPLPDRWARWPVIRHVASGGFHALHHRDAEHNYGFYTVVWDRLFGTLGPTVQPLDHASLSDATRGDHGSAVGPGG